MGSRRPPPQSRYWPLRSIADWDQIGSLQRLEALEQCDSPDIIGVQTPLLPPRNSTVSTIPIGNQARDSSIMSSIRMDDLVLTLIIFLGGLQDFLVGIFRLVDPRWTLIVISDFNETEVSDPMVRLTLVSGWGALEAGLLGMGLVCYRIFRWWNRRHFNGLNFQVALSLSTISKLGAFFTNASLTGWKPFSPDAPADNRWLFVRALITFACFVLSLITYPISFGDNLGV